MCQKCLEAVKKYYPHLTGEDVGLLLWSATAYPMGGPEQIERQLKEVRAATDGTLDAAIGYATKQMDAASKGAK